MSIIPPTKQYKISGYLFRIMFPGIEYGISVAVFHPVFSIQPVLYRNMRPQMPECYLSYVISYLSFESLGTI